MFLVSLVNKQNDKECHDGGYSVERLKKINKTILWSIVNPKID